MQQHIRPCQILIVEDDYGLAQQLAETVESSGATVLGPVADTRSALSLAQTENVDFAILDIILDSETVFPLARQLAERDIPFVFATGYGKDVVPRLFSTVPLLSKPVASRDVLLHIEALHPPCSRHQDRPAAPGNQILRQLDEDRLNLIRPCLRRLDIPAHHVTRGDGLVYFVEEGLAVGQLPSAEKPIALAYFGSDSLMGEAVTGLQLDYTWLTRSRAYAMEADDWTALSAELGLGATAQSARANVAIQAAWTAQSAATVPIIGQLARAILMCADRIGDHVPVTHLTFSNLLAVRRAGVTDAMHYLEYEGAIRSTRSLVIVRDRERLIRRAGPCYGDLRALASTSGREAGTPEPLPGLGQETTPPSPATPSARDERSNAE